MLKRILLIVALGVSFVPAAFASTDSFGNCQHAVGSNSPCELSEAIGDGATQCDKDRDLADFEADNVAHGLNRDGTTHKALAP